VIVRYDHRAGAFAKSESGTGGQGLGRCGCIFNVWGVDGDLARVGGGSGGFDDERNGDCSMDTGHGDGGYGCSGCRHGPEYGLQTRPAKSI